VKRFVPDPDELVILGCGLDPDHATRLVTECRTPSERGEYGVFEMIEKRRALDGGGSPRGFEVLSYE
jgi:hypothetical protein